MKMSKIFHITPVFPSRTVYGNAGVRIKCEYRVGLHEPRAAVQSIFALMVLNVYVSPTRIIHTPIYVQREIAWLTVSPHHIGKMHRITQQSYLRT